MASRKKTCIYVCTYSTHKIKYPQALGHDHSNYSLIHSKDKNMIKTHGSEPWGQEEAGHM